MRPPYLDEYSLKNFRGFEQDWRLSMRNQVFGGMILVLLLLITPAIAKATNESSYQYGYMNGSLKGPGVANTSSYLAEFNNNICRLSNSSVLYYTGAIIPAVTNTTACQNGFFAGWKDWCINHAVNCVGNLTLGYLPDLLIKTHQEYQKGYTISNGTYNQCSIGENNAFCTGWYDNMVKELVNVDLLLIMERLRLTTLMDVH